MLSRSHAIVGTGLVALDVILTEDSTDPILAAGGTCGNVLAILAAWGWSAYPVARLGDDPSSRHVLDDLARWDVNLQFAQLEPTRPAPVFIEKLRLDGTHRFSSRCPSCGGWLPRYSPVTGSAVREARPSLPTADAFFFDRLSRGALDLATSYAEAGTMVFFEPSASGSPKHMAEAVRIADIAKYSIDRFDGLSGDGALPAGLKLEIATMGSAGLRYRGHVLKQPSVWRHSPAIAAEGVRDTAGAGDWFTAALLHLLMDEDIDCVSEAEIDAMIKHAQEIAAQSVSFVGARGAMGQISPPAAPKNTPEIVWRPQPIGDFQCGACPA